MQASTVYLHREPMRVAGRGCWTGVPPSSKYDAEAKDGPVLRTEENERNVVCVLQRESASLGA